MQKKRRLWKRVKKGDRSVKSPKRDSVIPHLTKNCLGRIFTIPDNLHNKNFQQNLKKIDNIEVFDEEGKEKRRESKVNLYIIRKNYTEGTEQRIENIKFKIKLEI